MSRKPTENEIRVWVNTISLSSVLLFYPDFPFTNIFVTTCTCLFKRTSSRHFKTAVKISTEIRNNLLVLSKSPSSFLSNMVRKYGTARSEEVESWEEQPNVWLTAAKNAFIGWTLNIRVPMLLKGAVKRTWLVKRDCTLYIMYNICS